MREIRGCEEAGQETALSDAKESETIMKVLVDAGCNEVIM